MWIWYFAEVSELLFEMPEAELPIDDLSFWESLIPEVGVQIESTYRLVLHVKRSSSCIEQADELIYSFSVASLFVYVQLILSKY